MIGRFIKDITGIQIGHQQTICITRHRTGQMLGVSHLSKESYIKGQRTIHNDISELSAISHFGQDCSLDRRLHTRQHLFTRSDSRNFRTFNSHSAGCRNQIAHKSHFLFQVRVGNHRNIRHKQQLMICWKFKHSHMAQYPFRWQQAILFVQNSSHVFIGRNETFHQ